LGRSQPKVGIASQAERPLARTLRQIAFRESLDPPGNATYQELLLVGTRSGPSIPRPFCVVNGQFRVEWMHFLLVFVRSRFLCFASPKLKPNVVATAPAGVATRYMDALGDEECKAGRQGL
jgi:hypothetical protein